MKILILLLVITLSVSVAFARVGAHDQAQFDPVLCVYEIIVRTGDVGYAGTDAKISLTLAGGDGSMLSIKDLASWGDNGPGYDYFERGNRDKFSGVGNCTTPEPCSMVLGSDNSGSRPGWYVDYIEVIEHTTDFTQVSHMFKLYQWLAKDEYPYQLYVYRDYCSTPGVTAMA